MLWLASLNPAKQFSLPRTASARLRSGGERCKPKHLETSRSLVIEIRKPRLSSELREHDSGLRVVLDLRHRLPGVLPGSLALRALRHHVGRLRGLTSVVGEPH